MLDPATRDWTDGLLSNIFRDMNKPVPEGKDERRYIVYDGDVDAVWVENMNCKLTSPTRTLGPHRASTLC